MKRFSFRLQRLLELRERAERLDAAAMGAAQREEARRRDALAATESAAQRAREQAATETGGAASTPAQRAHLDLASAALGRQAEQLEGDVSEAVSRTADARTKWSERRKDRRAVERLRERRLESWQEESRRAEQKTMDELAQRPRQTEEE